MYAYCCVHWYSMTETWVRKAATIVLWSSLTFWIYVRRIQSHRTKLGVAYSCHDDLHMHAQDKCLLPHYNTLPSFTKLSQLRNALLRRLQTFFAYKVSRITIARQPVDQPCNQLISSVKSLQAPGMYCKSKHFDWLLFVAIWPLLKGVHQTTPTFLQIITPYFTWNNEYTLYSIVGR